MPDIDVWGDLAVEFAAEQTDVPAARLPLIRASSFPDEARIKAWAFCDYLLRRDPALLRTLDRTAGSAARRTEIEVAAVFAESTDGLELATLDADWRRLWTEDTPLLRTITGKKTPLEAVSKAAPAALEEFNRLRGIVGREDVSWSADYSALCKQHAGYLRLNRGARGPLEENTQLAGKRGFSNAGRLFAERALVATNAKKLKDAFERWIDWPGFRDAIINPQLELVGLYVDGSILVMEASRGQNHENSQSTSYPNDGQKDVPHAISVKELGPEVQAALKRRGHGKAKQVGYPISIHFFRSAFMPKRKSIQCRLRRDGREDVRGFVHIGDGGKVRRTSSDGLAVFYAFEPLHRGTRFTVEWSFVRSDGSTASTQPAEFTTK